MGGYLATYVLDMITQATNIGIYPLVNNNNSYRLWD